MELFTVYDNDIVNHDGEILCTMNDKGKITYISTDYKKYKRYYKKILKLARKTIIIDKVCDSDNIKWLHAATTSPNVKMACALYIDLLNSVTKTDDLDATYEALTRCKALINDIIRIEKVVI